MSADGAAPLGAAVTPDDVTSALQLLRMAARWALTPVRWAEVSTVVTAATGALAADDGQALRASLGRITVLAPRRAATPSTVTPAPDAVVTDLTALIGALAELAREVRAPAAAVPVTFPVSIYLSDDDGHERVEAAVEALARSAGMIIAERDEPVLGSWFRRMRAVLMDLAGSRVGQEALADAARRAEIELVERSEAQVTALLMANAAPLIAGSLNDARDAVVRFGAVLIVKHEGALYVNQLTARQQLILNHSPHLLTAPDRIFHALGLPRGKTAAVPGDAE